MMCAVVLLLNLGRAAAKESPRTPQLGQWNSDFGLTDCRMATGSIDNQQSQITLGLHR